MPTWLISLLIVLVALVVLLAVGGAVANARRMRAEEERFHAQVEEANHALAEAHAQDRGWERGGLEAAVQREVAARSPDVEIRQLSLVAVIDRPGTDEDRAVFRVRSAEGDSPITLVRRGGDWVAE